MNSIKDEKGIAFRKATIKDLDLLDYWDTKQHVIDSDPDDDEWDWEDELPMDYDWREILMAELNGKPIGNVILYDPYREITQYWGDKIGKNLMGLDIYIGEESDLGRGYGETMMRLAFSRSFADSRVQAVIIDPLKSNIRAIKFYNRLGFEYIGDKTFGTTDCETYQMTRRKWEHFYSEDQ